ncbi:nucleotide-binding protein [Delftia acidovorans]|uniref:nucleotide-binding protein n=1 Tax=Delftia acidovorans TaxID=80866 RepID=UPI00334112A7
MYYHVYIETRLDAGRGEYRADLTREQLISRYLEPYELAKPIVINGRTIQTDSIKRIKVYQSNKLIEYYIPAIAYENSQSSVTFIGGPSNKETAILRSNDVTDEFIEGPAGYKLHLINTQNTNMDTLTASNERKVFIVHGHSQEAQAKVARFVEKLKFEAIILHEKASAGRTIIEKIDHYTNVGFGIVIYTPDDVGNSKANSENLNGRARQNVVFEHGYLISKLGRERVVALVEQPIELPNDISGVVYINLDEANAWHLQLSKEMKQAGYSIDMNSLIN